jgi:hypothetical protein
MTRGLALVALVLALAPAGAAAEQSATGKATLQLVRGASLVVRGMQFVPGEQVTVNVTTGRNVSKRVVADGRGAFVVRFRISFDRCSSGVIARAVGSRGSRALVKRPPHGCPPRL